MARGAGHGRERDPSDMKKTTHHILFLAHVLLAAETFAQTVEIGERSVPLAFTNSPAGSFDTNRVSRELTAFFRIADTPETLFRSDMSPPGESMPLRPACPLVPPVVISDEIRYVPPPDEQVVIGTNALAAMGRETGSLRHRRVDDPPSVSAQPPRLENGPMDGSRSAFSGDDRQVSRHRVSRNRNHG